jgi:hypothetical protein
MSLLPAGRPLARLLPDLEDLLHDPHAYLAREPLTIGPRQMFGLAFSFGAAGIALILSCTLVAGPTAGERLALGAGLLAGALVWLSWSLFLRGHSLVLRDDGVEVCYRDTTIWCPWALFSVEGHAFVPDADSPRVGLTLPINTEAVPFIEQRFNGAPVAHGIRARGRQWQLIAADEVVLPARYEVRAGELGELLLLLGRRLGRRLPAGTPPPEAQRLAEIEPLPAPDPDGWITVYLTRLRLPPICCDCGEGTTQTLTLYASPGVGGLLGELTGTGQPLELPVPVCPSCKERLRARQRGGALQGLRLGALAALSTGMLLALGRGVQDTTAAVVLGVGALAAGGLGGFLLGTLLARRLPAEVSRYSPGSGTLRIRFRNPDYTSLVLQAMQQRARKEAKQPPPW